MVEIIDTVEDEGVVSVKTVLKNFKRAREYKRHLLEEMKEDYEFAVGKQWSDDDVKDLKAVGVKALTINKIQANLFLISGVQRQNRADYRAFPEGDEDTLLAEIATLLLKNSLKASLSQHKMSEVYEDGLIGGEGYVEGYIDYTYDLLNGDLKLKKDSPFQIFNDPEATEYDLSDAEFQCKLSEDLTEDKLIRLYPDKKDVIKTIEKGKLDMETVDLVLSDGDYPSLREPSESADFEQEEKSFDLLEYHFKNYVTKYFVADEDMGTISKPIDTKREAEDYLEAKAAQGQPGRAVIIERIIPEIWTAVLVGTVKLDEFKSTFYPRWKGFPIIPFFAHRITTKIKDSKYMVQGVVRSLKDPQIEINKRKTQKLRHLNTSANSGWLSKVNSWVDKNIVKKFGSAPGILLEWKGNTAPQRIEPTQLSQGHTQLEMEATNELKEISGINADLLSQEDKTASGRAIFLRQQQGMVMLQRLQDNFKQTEKLLGRFILSQLSELYTVETATRVAGETFISENFSVPIMVLAQRGAQKQQQGIQPTEKEMQATQQVAQFQAQKAQELMQAQDRGEQIDQAQIDAIKQGQVIPVDEQGELITMVDDDAVGYAFNKVLTDEQLNKFDIIIGQSATSETIKMANSSLLMDMAQAGIPVPPQVIIDESLISEASKKKIEKAFAQAQQQVQR